jgi:Ubiquitin fusion degradation protein UFD1
MAASPPDDDEISDDESMYPLARRFQQQAPVSSPSPAPLQWSQQLLVYSLANDPSDRVVLPPAALEQLLSRVPLNTDLPQPLTFRVFNPRNDKFTHVGVREFSAPVNTVGIPAWIIESLGLHEDDAVTVAIRDLPKATRVKLRPLEAGYIEDDWKALLESQLRTHTTLTKGEILSIRTGLGTTFRFLVDELEPSDAVNLIDTDVTTEIEEMSEDNARKTQDQRIQAAKLRTSTNNISTNVPVEGSVTKEGYAYFKLGNWDRKRNLQITLESEGDADLLIGTSESWKPLVDLHLWSNMSSDANKRIFIAQSNIELSNAPTIQIAIHGYADATFQLKVDQPHDLTTEQTSAQNAHAFGFTQCENCLNWVPERSLMLHQNFCLRNNWRCTLCNTVLPKKEQSNHWHCQDCSAHGNTSSSYDKHSFIEHTPQTCLCSTSFPSLATLAFHRATACPLKLIKCRFCQTYKEQGDPSTLSAQDMLAGLTAHEADCGSRTVECAICNRRLRIKELEVHQKLHDNQRKARPVPINCRNINCTRPRGDNVLGLCTVCPRV